MSWLSLSVINSKVTETTQSGKLQIKIIVPKRVAKLAVRRNRLRRLIKEALRLGFHPSGKREFVFRVSCDPGAIGIRQTMEAIQAAWKSHHE